MDAHRRVQPRAEYHALIGVEDVHPHVMLVAALHVDALVAWLVPVRILLVVTHPIRILIVIMVV